MRVQIFQMLWYGWQKLCSDRERYCSDRGTVETDIVAACQNKDKCMDQISIKTPSPKCRLF